MYKSSAMKKSFVVLMALAATTTVSLAQSKSFGIKTGITNNYLTYRIDNDDDTRILGGNTGFYAGGVANFQLAENFAIQPNLLLAMKGGSVESYKVNTWHIDIPVNFLFTHNGFFIGAGPNFSYALSGTLDPDDEKVNIFEKDEAGPYTLKKFEIGANCLMGYNFPGGVTLSASFTPGLNDIYDGGDDDIKAHFKSFGLSVGYMFGKKK